jgi:hypothetical protein
MNEIKIESKYIKTYKTEVGLQKEVTRLDAIAEQNGERLRWVKGVADDGNHAIVIINSHGKQVSAVNMFLGTGHLIVG